MLPPEDVICVPAGAILPVHPPRDSEALEYIFKSMKKDGWLGRPLLVIRTGRAKYQALTGSHRLAAARMANLPSIPVFVVEGAPAEVIRTSQYFPLYPPGLVQDLFQADFGWLGRFILMDQLTQEMEEPWSEEALDFLRELGHDDMIEIMSVRKWPCQK